MMATEAYAIALAEMRKPLPDAKLAFKQLLIAHEQGDPEASYAIGTWYLFGQDKVVRKNYKKASVYLKAAAKANIPDALYDLAIMFEKAEGVDRDLKRAFILYLRAAMRNHAKATREVSRCYSYGIGVAANRKIAHAWFDRAIELGGIAPP